MVVSHPLDPLADDHGQNEPWRSFFPRAEPQAQADYLHDVVAVRACHLIAVTVGTVEVRLTISEALGVAAAIAAAAAQFASDEVAKLAAEIAAAVAPTPAVDVTEPVLTAGTHAFLADRTGISCGRCGLPAANQRHQESTS